MIDSRACFVLSLGILAAAACGSGSGDTGSGGAGAGGDSTSHGASGPGSGGGPPACKMGETHSCYSGPSGTADVGICKSGVQDCTDDGTFGPCHGEVLPKEEDCSARGDEDCDGNACSDAIWVVDGAGTGSQEVDAIALDLQGNTYVTGIYSGQLKLGKSIIPSTGADFDVFVAKLDSSGQLVWQKNIPAGGGKTAVPTGIAFSSQGDVAISVVTDGESLAFPTTTFPGATAGYVAAFDKDGKGKWAKAITATTSIGVVGVGYGKSDNVVVAGNFGGTLTCTASGCPGASTGGNAYIRAYAASGTELWTQSYGGNENGTVLGLSLTGDDIFISGKFLTTIDLAGKTFTSSGDADAFGLRTKSNGDAQVAVAIGTAGYDEARAIAGKEDGGFVLGGSASDAITIGSVTTGVNTEGAFVFAFDGSGTEAWAHGLGTSGTSTISSMAADFGGNVWATGTVIGGEADFGGGPVDADAKGLVGISSLDGSGGFRWGKTFKGTGGQSNPHIAANRNRLSAFSLEYNTTIDIGLGTMSSNHDGQAVVTLFQP